MRYRRHVHIYALATIIMLAGVWGGQAIAGCIEQSRTTNSRKTIDTQDLSLDAMIGQMLMVGFDGSEPAHESVSIMRDQLARGIVGGVFFLKRNIKNKAQIARLTRYFLSAKSQLPPFISVDQEGGKVQRLNGSNGFSSSPSAYDVARKHGTSGADRIYRRMAKQLHRAGFNLNLGPVVDVNVNRSNPVIAKLERSYGRDPARVVAFARSFVKAHRAAGILTAIKHYPGHGNSASDSHLGFVDITRTWRPLELEPYRAMYKAKAVDMVMVGHLYHPDFADGARTPATLSRKAISHRLRGDVGKDVVVITDDMEMGAIRDLYATDTAIIQAIIAGNDILLFSQTKEQQRSFPESFLAIVKAAISDGRLSRKRIATSYRRIARLKQCL